MEDTNQAIKTETKYEVTSCYFCNEFLDNNDFKVNLKKKNRTHKIKLYHAYFILFYLVQVFNESFIHSFYCCLHKINLSFLCLFFSSFVIIETKNLFDISFIFILVGTSRKMWPSIAKMSK